MKMLTKVKDIKEGHINIYGGTGKQDTRGDTRGHEPKTARELEEENRRKDGRRLNRRSKDGIREMRGDRGDGKEREAENR